MKYKGYTMTAVYLPGSDTRELKDGTLVKRKPKPSDIDYIATEHSVTYEILPNSSSFKEAKAFIKMYTAL